MHQLARAGLSLALGAVLVVQAGCGGEGGGGAVPSDPMEAFHQNTLNEVGEILAVQKTDSTKPPTGVADLAKYKNGWPAGFSAVQKGDVVVLWGVPIDEAASDKVLAHEKQAAESGGFVLMQDAKTVKKLTADEFKAAPKAGKN